MNVSGVALSGSMDYSFPLQPMESNAVRCSVFIQPLSPPHALQQLIIDSFTEIFATVDATTDRFRIVPSSTAPYTVTFLFFTESGLQYQSVSSCLRHHIVDLISCAQSDNVQLVCISKDASSGLWGPHSCQVASVSNSTVVVCICL